MTMDAATESRIAFNLKVLRKHDASIVQIIETASFVVLYNYNGEWTKTGVEGPMFLIRRDSMPYNGFFILNRNGVENFSADVTQDDDLELTPEFVIYRPESRGDNEIYGIWVFESGQREIVGQKLLELQQMTEAPIVQLPVLADVSTTQPTSANGKAAPGKSKKNTNKTQASKKVPTSDAKPSTNAVVEASTDSAPGPQISLDDLFGPPAPESHDEQSDEKSQQEPSPMEATQFKEDDIASSEAPNTSLLDSLFQKAASINPFANDGTEKQATQQATASPSVSTPQSNSLLSLLGVQARPEPSPTGSDSNKVAPSDSDSPAETPSKVDVTTTTPPTAPRMAELVETNARNRIGLGDDGQPLTRREFVTELLSMIHTDPDFVTELYKSYTTRVS